MTQLHLAKCARHPVREAAARCVSCKGMFCRECATEHDGKILCADCLARSNAERQTRRRPLAAAGRLAALALSVWITWSCFFLLGKMLLAIPPEFHDGTFWERLLL